MLWNLLMVLDTESLSSNLLELASEQRLKILQLVKEDPQTLSEINKKLNITASETHRNLQRLLDSQLLDKNNEGKYFPSALGYTIFFQLDSMEFLTGHKKFWQHHIVSNLPDHFVRRLGDLAESELVSGFVKVQEMWQKIYQNSSRYVCTMLQEASYDTDTISTIQGKLKDGIVFHSMFSQDSVISEKRDSVKSEFLDFIKNGTLERRTCKSFPAVVFLNENEGCVCFSHPEGRVDLSYSFYGKSKSFQMWCLDFFDHFWENSSRFSESKIDNF